MRDLAVGVDCGATSARAVVVDMEGRQLARYAHGEGAPASAHDPAPAVRAVLAAARGAIALCDSELPVASLWAGVAGAGRRRVNQGLESALAGAARLVTVGTDSTAAFQAAFGDDDGIVLISGTGSVGLARRTVAAASGGETREMVQVGGWGPIIDDAGSGCWFGHQALRAVMRADDGRGPPTSLSRTVSRFLKVTGQGYMSWAELASRRDFATLAPIVLEACERGDAVAGEIARTAVRELAEVVRTARARLAPSEDPVPVALAGGLIKEGGPLRTRLLAELERLEGVRVVAAGDAALGAAKLAVAAVEEARRQRKGGSDADGAERGA